MLLLSGIHLVTCMNIYWYYLLSVGGSHSVVSDSLWPHGLCSPWNSPGQNTGVGSLSLLQGIFPPRGLNPGLPHCRQIIYQLSHKGSPRILEWVAYPFSSRFQESAEGIEPGSPHCRWIFFYQLSYQGSPSRGVFNYEKSYSFIPERLWKTRFRKI